MAGDAKLAPIPLRHERLRQTPLELQIRHHASLASFFSCESAIAFTFDGAATGP
jgi:hypothetical protein